LAFVLSVLEHSAYASPDLHAYLCKSRKTPEVMRVMLRFNHAMITILQRNDIGAY
jgi:hypothetical protein